MKAILISDHAKWCALMMNGKKNVEVRKGTALYKAIQKLIDEYGYAEFYVYCCKGNQNLLDVGYADFFSPRFIIRKDHKNRSLNGKVLFKFRCYKGEEIKQYIGVFWRWGGHPYYTNNVDEYKLLERSCLSITELENYLKDKTGYAIHISDLEIFDKPKELNEFKGCSIGWNNCIPHNCKECPCSKSLTKAPQNFCYVEVEK